MSVGLSLSLSVKVQQKEPTRAAVYASRMTLSPHLNRHETEPSLLPIPPLNNAENPSTQYYKESDTSLSRARGDTTVTKSNHTVYWLKGEGPLKHDTDDSFPSPLVSGASHSSRAQSHHQRCLPPPDNEGTPLTLSCARLAGGSREVLALGINKHSSGGTRDDWRE